MYDVFLFLHNLLRWVVLILAAWALYRAYRGWFQKAEWTDQDRKAGIFFTSSMDTQLLIGGLLYFVFSPFGLPGLLQLGMGTIMGGGEQYRQYAFFGVEHIFSMVVAVVLAHVGSAMAKKQTDPVKKHQRAAIFYTLSILAVLFAIPWWRPLVPGL